MGIRLLYIFLLVYLVRVVSSFCEYCLFYFDYELKFVFLLVDFDFLLVFLMCYDFIGLGY